MMVKMVAIILYQWSFVKVNISQ